MTAKFQTKTVKVALTTTLTGTALALAACSPSKGTSTVSEVSRLQVMNQQLSLDTNSSQGVSAQSVSVNAPSLTLTGAITPPSVNGLTLQANSTSFTGTNVYVSYNIAGAGVGGGVDQISIATPAVPILQSSLQFPTLDVNNVLVSNLLNGFLFVSGNSSTYDSPARLQRYNLGALGAIGSLVNDSPLVGYAADSTKGNTLLSNMIYSVSGDNGGLTIQDSTALTSATATPPPLTVSISDARDIATTNVVSSLFTGFRAFVITGNSQVTTAAGSSNGTYTVPQTQGLHSYIRSYDSNGVEQGYKDIGDTGPAQAKSTIQAGATYGIASAGTGGVRVFCLADLGILATATPSATGGVVNGAAYIAGYVFTAEGDQGVGVYALSGATGSLGACTNTTLTRLGSISFGTSVSANNVTAVGTLLLVSGGLGGFKIVTVTPSLTATGLVTTL